MDLKDLLVHHLGELETFSMDANKLWSSLGLNGLMVNKNSGPKRRYGINKLQRIGDLNCQE